MSADIVLAGKCAPVKRILYNAEMAGLKAMELYLSESLMRHLNKIIKICRDFSFKYAVHAPNDCYDPSALAELTKGIKAKAVVFHDMYWEDEWRDIVDAFKDTKTRICVENTNGVHSPSKIIRRYGLQRCLDLEHLQMECCGIFEEEFMRVFKEASHIHLTGYIYGSRLWHTHINHSPEHSTRILNLLKKSNYSGFVVSEARTSLQTYGEFKRLNNFYKMWRRKCEA